MTIETAFKDMVKEAVREVLAEQQPKAGPLPEGKPAMSLKEAAAYVGVPYSTMNNWSHRADCTFCVPVGAKRYVLTHKLCEWLEQTAAEREGSTA